MEGGRRKNFYTRVYDVIESFRDRSTTSSETECEPRRSATNVRTGHFAFGTTVATRDALYTFNMPKKDDVTFDLIVFIPTIFLNLSNKAAAPFI